VSARTQAAQRRSWNRATCGRRIGMCEYTAVPEDGRTCSFFTKNMGVLQRRFR